MFAPFGNQTANQTATWHPEPRGRGTFGLLSSCITTLVLCVYTTIHLNIPEHGKERQQYFRKIGWVVLGLLAPEIVAWNAWEQYRTASRITQVVHKAYPPALTSPWYQLFWASCKRVPRRWFSTGVDTRKCLDSQIPLSSLNPDTSAHRHPWTLTHGFYAVMGGFVIQAGDLGPSYGTGAFVLSERGINFLAETMPEWIPNIPESEILDKSKASTLTKTIVCLQALWFCIQCIARLSQGASISFLELNVLGHCLCAFATYAIWWKKPFDVSRPTSLSVSDGLREYADVVYLYSSRPGALPIFPTIPGMRSDTQASVDIDVDSNLALMPHDPQSLENITKDVCFGDLLRSAITAERCGLVASESCYHLTLRLYTNIWIRYYLYPTDTGQQTAVESAHDVPRAVFGFDLEPAMAEHLERTSESRYELGYRTIFGLKPPSPRNRNWSLSSDSVRDARDFKEPLSSITLVIVALVYGGLHLLAWNAPFHTRIEETLWKISGISVASIGPMSIAYAGLLSVTEKFFWHINLWHLRHWNPSRTRSRSKIIRFLNVSENIVEKIIQVLGVSYLLFYSFTRVYLVVECFIEVAYLPDSAFTTPVFTRYIPHLG
ncbi:hypothetical protein D6D28_09968 [Aureobasidium pullulans]|uniref:Uncharacterized protein n=1 Tax=Aureobasidium pullulans TaxID=5580 RepID=A0A4S8RZB6_AURPU|nr:hypothetical protein D6D28_09968 [Aureobasidium pullulans]